MSDLVNGEYFDYCEKLNLIPTDSGYKQWLEDKVSCLRKPTTKQAETIITAEPKRYNPCTYCMHNAVLCKNCELSMYKAVYQKYAGKS